MKCPYNPDMDCPNIDTAFMDQGKPCYDCEYNDHNPKTGCLRVSAKLILIIILLI